MSYKKFLATLMLLCAFLLSGVSVSGFAQTQQPSQTVVKRRVVNQNQSNTSTKHKRHMKTAKRVGVGAAGGAVVGALAGGGKGAAIGAAAGAGAGALYDKHKKRKEQ
jgi:outer membrane lipoprotein SlyB